MGQTGPMDDWAVAGAVLELDDDGVLLVSNRRRDGSVDWSTPGGVIDAGETPLGALAREVREETGLDVVDWGRQLYSIDIEFVDLGNRLAVSVFAARSWTGQLTVDDPDGIVEDARFCPPGECGRVLEKAFPWVREPLEEWLDERWTGLRQFRYRAEGDRLSELTAVRL